MGSGIANQPAVMESITAADPADHCDVCGRTKDVAQVIGIMEGPEGVTDGLATVIFLCSFCGARIIQATTGFKAVRQLKSWYLVRERHPSLAPEVAHLATKDDDYVG